MVTLLNAPKEPSVLYVPEHVKAPEPEPVLLGGIDNAKKDVQGRWISTRTWVLTNKKNGRKQTICLLDNQMSDDAIATAYGEAVENFYRDTNDLPRLATYTVEQRKEVGAAIRRYREFKAKMAESTNNKVFYRGVR